MTPGMKTSEFLMALVPMVIGFALVVLGTFKGQANLVELGIIMMTGTAGTYSLSRGLAKFGKTPTPPEPVPPPATDKSAASTVAGIR